MHLIVAALKTDLCDLCLDLIENTKQLRSFFQLVFFL